ncbi:MAG: toxic anion resistance protein [Lachnospiraceae bacterium]|nr:toxic anion resistance protein [Lachnospiraceae bacterium]
MGINFTKQPEEVAVQTETGLEIVEEYNIQAERERMTRELTNSKEVDDLVSTINVYEAESIVTFGAEVAEEISKSSDAILNNMNMSQINESGEMLQLLAKIMDNFDKKELEELNEEPKGISKIFRNAKKQMEKILAKYHTMGEEIDKIYIKLKQYESEIKESNKSLDTMFQTNIAYYNQLVKYILAGEQGIRELDALIEERQNSLQKTQDSSIQFELTALEQAKNMLEQRTQDLRIAENVALQSIPMIKTMEYSNMNLVRKINSAFIITLPIFKQALSQAILLKRQKVQAEAMAALDEKTNEMLLKNAQNTVAASKMTAKLASGNSIKIETLETTWRTIVDGIEATKAIQLEAKKQREEDQVRLNQIKGEFDRMFHIGEQSN